MWKKTTGWLFEVQKRNGILEEKDRRLYEYACAASEQDFFCDRVFCAFQDWGGANHDAAGPQGGGTGRNY